jgi:hypothetical protein
MALFLADLLRDPGLEEVIRGARGPALGTRFDWVWKPFARRGDERMTTNVGVLADLMSDLARDPHATLPDGVRPDLRILVPLALVDPDADSPVRIEGPVDGWMTQLGDPVESVRAGRRAERDVVREMTTAGALPFWRGWLIGRMPPQEARQTLEILLTSGCLTKAIWDQCADQLADRGRSNRWGLIGLAVASVAVISLSVAPLFGWHRWKPTGDWVVPTVGLTLASALGGLILAVLSWVARGSRTGRRVEPWVLVMLVLSSTLATLFAPAASSLTSWVSRVVLGVQFAAMCFVALKDFRSARTTVNWDLVHFVGAVADAYAPGQGPGVATSGSSSTLVSNSVNPRRR